MNFPESFGGGAILAAVAFVAIAIVSARALGRLLLIGGVQQIAHGEAGFLCGDHIEDRGLRHVLLVQGVQERARRVAQLEESAQAIPETARPFDSVISLSTWGRVLESISFDRAST